MQETTLMDVTKMNAHDEAQANEGTPDVQAQGTPKRLAAASVSTQFMR